MRCVTSACQILTADSLPQIRELVPESQAYMDLLAFERKLDQTIMRKRVDIQEALKRPMKVLSLQCTHRTSRCQSNKGGGCGILFNCNVSFCHCAASCSDPLFLRLNCAFPPMLSCQQQKRKLRLYISNTFNPARPDADDSDGSIASWELRVEGKLLDDVSLCLMPRVENERGDCNLFVVLCCVALC